MSRRKSDLARRFEAMANEWHATRNNPPRPGHAPPRRHTPHPTSAILVRTPRPRDRASPRRAVVMRVPSARAPPVRPKHARIAPRNAPGTDSTNAPRMVAGCTKSLNSSTSTM